MLKLQLKKRTLCLNDILIMVTIFFIPYTNYRIAGLKISEIIMLVLIIYTFLKGSVQLSRNYILKFIIGFSIIILISGIFSWIDPMSNLKTGIDEGIYYSFEYGFIFKIIRWYIVGLFWYITSKYLSISIENCRQVCFIYVLSNVLLGIYTIMMVGISRNYIIGIHRTAVMAIEPSEAGFINVVALIIVVFRLIIKREYNLNNIISIIILAFAQLLIGSAASTGFAVAAIGIITIFYFQDKKVNVLLNRSKVLIVVLISLICAYYLIFNTDIFDKVLNWEKNMNIEGSSIVERITAIQTGWILFLKRPLLGIGWGNYGWYVDVFKVNNLFRTVGGGSFSANNQYIIILCELGIAGSIIFIRFIYKMLGNVKKIRLLVQNNIEDSYFVYTFCCVIIFVLLNNLTLNGIYSFQFWIALAFIQVFNTKYATRRKEINGY